MTISQRFARLATRIAVASPRLARLLRRPLRRQFDRLAPQWDRIVGPGHLAALEAALAELPPPRRALDVGTGTGNAAFLVAERFPDAEVTGVDVSPAMVAAAEAKIPPALAGRVRFLAADASALPLPDGGFDLVTLANAIPFFAELDRVLAADGTVLVSYSHGPATPIWVPPETLRARFAERGFSHFADFVAGDATCLLARRR